MNGLPASVLFACSENSVRSPMAEGLAKRLYGRAAFIDSVGVRGKEIDGFVFAVLDEIDVDINHAPKTFDDIDPSSYDLIVTLSPEAHHRALEATRGTAAEVEYWPVYDPSAVEGSREMRLDAYRRLRDQLMARLKTRFGASSGPTV